MDENVNQNPDTEMQQDQSKTGDEAGNATTQSLEEYLKDESNKAAYDAAVADAVSKELEKQAAQKAEEERQKGLSDEEKMSEREQAIAKREAELLKAELRSEAVISLGKEKLPAGLAECFDYSSKESYETSRKAVTAAFQEAVKTAVNDRLRGKNLPVADTGTGEGTGTVRSAGDLRKIIRENQVKR